jgi:hypothetical protein
MSEGENRRPFGRMILTALAPAVMSVASPAGRRTGPPPAVVPVLSDALDRELRMRLLEERDKGLRPPAPVRSLGLA